MSRQAIALLLMLMLAAELALAIARAIYYSRNRVIRRQRLQAKHRRSGVDGDRSS